MRTTSINKKWMGPLILACILVCLCGELAHAQVVYENAGENWLYSYGNVSYKSLVHDVVENPYDGTIICTGKEVYTEAGRTKFKVICLRSTGGHKWSYEYGTQSTYNEGHSVVVGADKYIYVAGVSYTTSTYKRRFTVIKLDSLGNERHLYQYDYASGQDDEAYDIVYGPDGYIYVAGYSEGSDNKYDFIVMKLDTALVQQHLYRLSSGSNYHAEARTIKVDSHLNVWAAGYAKGPSNTDFTVVKLDTALTVDTIYQYNGTGNSTDEAYSLCLPWSGTDVYAAGYSYGGSDHGNDFTVICLDSSGTERWVYTYDGPGNGDDQAYAVVSGPLGGTYAAGYSTDIAGGGGKDYTVICLYGSLEAWVWRYNRYGDGDDQAKAIGINSLGNLIYAAGYTTRDGSNTDVIVTKHDYWNDSPTWVYQYNGNNGNDVATSIDISSLGTENLCVGGYIRPFGGGDGHRMAVINLPENFPPPYPEYISPVNSGFLNDTTAVTFIWHAVEDPEGTAVSYTLQYTKEEGYWPYDSIILTDTFHIMTINDTIYYWGVLAQDADGNRIEWVWDIWTFSFDFIAPNTPVLMSPISDTLVLDSSVTFDWGEVTFMGGPPAPVRYVFQIDTSISLISPIVEDTFDVNTTILSLPGDDYYYWRIKAYDLASNESPYSDAESFRVDITPPLIDSTTELENTPNIGPFSVYTKVTDALGIDNVTLYFKRMEDPVWFPAEMIEGSGNIYFEEIPSVSMANDTVKYYIYAKDNAGYESTDPVGAPTDYYWFIAGYTGMMEFDTPTVFSFGLRSNPAKGKALFNLALPEAATVTLRIYDATGRLLDKVISGKQAAGYYEISWSKDVSSGIFFYHLDSPWQQKIGKLVLIR